MLGSTVLEVAIGLVFCYASVALIVSSIQEAIASALRLRANSLLAGIKTLLNDPNFDQLARQLYRHALVNPHADGTPERPLPLPSYIDARHFAIALIDILGTVPGDFAQLGHDIAALPDAQLRQLLGGLYRRAGGNLGRLQRSIAAWFDAGMERSSGQFKRRTQLMCFLIALALAATFNIDSFHLFQALWQHPVLLNAASGALDDATMEALAALPIGWQHMPASLPLALAGWLLTASSTLFGAPFWFDLLQRLVRLRGTGKKPKSSRPAKRG